MRDIGQILKKAREEKKLTQEKVMQLTGINKKSLSGYENNVAEPNLQTFAVLARLYDLSADHILEIDPELSKKIPTTEERQILDTISRLDDEHLAELEDLLKIMVRYSGNEH